MVSLTIDIPAADRCYSHLIYDCRSLRNKQRLYYHRAWITVAAHINAFSLKLFTSFNRSIIGLKIHGFVFIIFCNCFLLNCPSTVLSVICYALDISSLIPKNSWTKIFSKTESKLL